MPLGRVYVPPPWSNQANQKLIDTNGNSDHYTPFKKIEIKIEKAPAPTESVVPSKFYTFMYISKLNKKRHTSYSTAGQHNLSKLQFHNLWHPSNVGFFFQLQ